MSRVLRPQMPGVAFHITARTQGKQPWFDDPLKSLIKQHIVEGVTSSDAILLAYVVMPNHFHIVVRQGTRPLGWVMQPIMRRIAIAVQQRRAVEGHVFERRFRSAACRDVDHLRRSIIYTHLNPLRAGLDINHHVWSSAALYERAPVEPCEVAVAFALKLFAYHADSSHAELRSSYLKYLAWRIEKDKHDAAGALLSTVEPRMPAGDRHFSETFCALPPSPHLPAADLRDKANQLLDRITVDVALDRLRQPRLPHRLAAVRRELIAALLERRYAARKIANFFRIADSTVSGIASQLRYGTGQKSEIGNVVR